MNRMVLMAAALFSMTSCTPTSGAAAFAADDCAGLAGDDFVANDFEVTGFDDPTLSSDFGAAGDELDLAFDDAGGFTSTFTPADGDVIETTGTVEFTPDTAAFSEPFLPGFETGGVDFECDFDTVANTLTLTGDGDFDIDEDGVAEPGVFAGTFTPSL